MKGRDFALLTDLYELTMMQGYYETGAYNRKVVFDLFYRKNPSGNGFAITAGLQQAIEYLDGLHFTEEDIAYLESLNPRCPHRFPPMVPQRNSSGSGGWNDSPGC